MAIISDIRAGDVACIKHNISEEDRALLLKFVGDRSKNGDIVGYFKVHILSTNKSFKISQIKRTQRTKTEYAQINVSGIMIPVQTRYLSIVSREPSHPATKIFL